MVHQAGHKINHVTESASTTIFMHTGQCSNRGNCDVTTGLCRCFIGYMNDNCDTVNMFAS